MKKIVGCFIILSMATGVFAATTVVTTSGAIQDAWGNGLPSAANTGRIDIDGTWTVNGSTVWAGWDVTQTIGTLQRVSNAITLKPDVIWRLEGGSILATDNSTGKAHVRVGDSSNSGQLIMTGGTVSADGYFDVAYNSLFRMSGGSVTGIAGSRSSNGGKSYIEGGSGTFGTISLTAAGTQMEFSGGSWTATGDLTFTSSTTSDSFIRFAAGDGALSVGGLNMVGSGYFDFITGSGGSLTVAGYDQSDFEILWNNEELKVDGQNSGVFSDSFDVTGSTLTMIPEPATISLFSIAGLALIFRRQFRK